MKKLVKEALKSGDILHCTSNGLLARLIKKFTKSRINHTALVIEIWGDIFIIDSQKDGTNPRPFLEWMKMYNYKYQIHRPKEFTTEQKKRAVSKWGNTPYDFASLLLWQPIYIITGKWHGRKDPRADDRMYCSEYVAWVFELKDWWKLSPQAVFDSLQNDIRFELLD